MSLSGVNGSSRSRTPLALKMALPTAAGTDDADLADAFGSSGAEPWVEFFDPVSVDVVDVGVGCNVVPRKVAVEDMTETGVEVGLFM